MKPPLFFLITCIAMIHGFSSFCQRKDSIFAIRSNGNLVVKYTNIAGVEITTPLKSNSYNPEAPLDANSKDYHKLYTRVGVKENNIGQITAYFPIVSDKDVMKWNQLDAPTVKANQVLMVGWVKILDVIEPQNMEEKRIKEQPHLATERKKQKGEKQNEIWETSINKRNNRTEHFAVKYKSANIVFHNDSFAVVKSKEFHGLINRRGQEVVSGDFTEISYFTGNLATIGCWTNKTLKFAIINNFGMLITPFIYTDAPGIINRYDPNGNIPFKNYAIYASTNRGTIIIDSTGKEHLLKSPDASNNNYASSRSNSTSNHSNTTVLCSECGKPCVGHFYYSIMCDFEDVPIGLADKYTAHYCSVRCLDIMQKREHLCQ